MRVTEPPTFNAIADALTERLVTVGVDEVVAVGEVGDEFPPQVAVTTAAMTVPVKPARLDFTTRALLMSMLAKVGILPLAGGPAHPLLPRMRVNPKSLVVPRDGGRHVFHRRLELLMKRSDVEPFL